MPDPIETLNWIDPDGNNFSLNDQGRFFVPAPGLDGGGLGVPTEVVSFEAVGSPGVYEQYVKIKLNELQIPILIFGDTPIQLEQNRRTLLEAMRPSRGVGILQHGSNDGQTRNLFCREVGRMRTIGAHTPAMLRTGLILQAADPFWYDTNYISYTLSPSGTVLFFQNPFLPVHLSPSSASGAFSVENLGQAEAWPKWVITGPGNTIVLTNVTTGEVLTINITLASSSQILTVDTNPGNPSVTREDGSNQWSAITSTSSLWSLAEGHNDITLSMAGTSGASQLQLQYRQRWESV